jgi:hypothetical protein
MARVLIRFLQPARTCETYINGGLFSNRHHKEKAKKLVEVMKEKFAKPLDPGKTIISLSDEAAALCANELSKLTPKQKHGDYATMLSVMIHCLQEFYCFQGLNIFKQLLSKDFLQSTDGPANLILSYLFEENNPQNNESNLKAKI